MKHLKDIRVMTHSFRSILITGASSGIGKALALELAEPKIVLHLTGRNQERLQETSELCEKKGAIVHQLAIDVTEKQHLQQCIAAWDQANPLDLVLANAGIAGSGLPDHNLTQRLEALVEVNILGVINTLDPVMEAMMKRGHGCIGLLGSMASFLPLPSSPAYSATKSMILTWGDAIAPTLKKHNVFLSVICPGFVRSKITDANNFPMPFFMESDRAARIIIKGLQKKKTRIAFPLPMYLILSLLSILPRFLQRILVTKMPNKE